MSQEEKERKEQEEARRKQDEDAKKKKALTNMTQQYSGFQQRVSDHRRAHICIQSNRKYDQLHSLPVYYVNAVSSLFYTFIKSHIQQDGKRGAKKQTEREKKRKILAERKKPLNVERLNEDKLK